MPKLKEIAKKRYVPSKVLHMSFPDEETRDFWKLTADNPHEYAARVATFSRALSGEAVTKAVQSSRPRWWDAATDESSRRSDALGRVLMMPMHSDSSSPSSRECDHPPSADAFLDGSSWRSPIGCNDDKTRQLTQGGKMKAPGVRARKRGTKLKRGAATQVMVYPRQKTKGVLVEASRDISRPLSSFMILAALKEAAALRGCEIKDLIPAGELEQYRKSRVYRKPSKAGQ